MQRGRHTMHNYGGEHPWNYAFQASAEKTPWISCSARQTWIGIMSHMLRPISCQNKSTVEERFSTGQLIDL